ncbi:MAG: hypothetical protein PHF86_10025 [Candidatus Nanoarchaeia archaeon]|nr:hypothetical protein [Candidatus Nanoarchaeia archaeon]
MNIGIIGANGFVGKELSNVLSKDYEVYDITKDNQSYFYDMTFDVLINANGNSKKYWANQNPIEDFELSTKSVYESIINFKFKKYIYISSVDAELSRLPYGLNKRLSEMIVKNIPDNKSYLILRCSVIIGKEMKKGILYDILNNKDVFISSNSKLQFITNTEIANIIQRLLQLNILNECIDISGKSNISVSDIGFILHKRINYKDTDDKLELQYYCNSTNHLEEYYNLKTSKEYILEVANERMAESV